MQVALTKSNSYLTKTVQYFFLLLIPFVLFLLFFPVSYLDISNISQFLVGDLGSYVVTDHLLRYSNYNFPLFYSELAHYPSQAPLFYASASIFTLITLPFIKSFGTFLPEQIQILGYFFLISVYALFYCAFIIFRKFNLTFSASMLSAFILTLFPPFVMRYGHGTLMGHFVILLAFYYLFFAKKHIYLSSILINVLGMSLHSYFAPMTLVIAGTKPFYENDFKINKESILEAFRISALNLIFIIVYMYCAGVFGTNGAVDNGSGFGYYSMNLNALLNPGNVSRFLPALPRGDGQYEGFQYLGLGLLLLCTISLCYRKTIIVSKGKFKVLLVMAIFFTIIALSDRIMLGNIKLLSIDKLYPDFIESTLRSSGRFFWATAYLLIIMAIVKIYNATSKKKFCLIILFATIVQLTDLNYLRFENLNIFLSPKSFLARDTHTNSYNEFSHFLSSLNENPPFIENSFTQNTYYDKYFYEPILASSIKRIPVTDMYVARHARLKDFTKFSSPSAALEKGGIVLIDDILELNKIDKNLIGKVYKLEKFYAVTPKSLVSNSFPELDFPL